MLRELKIKNFATIENLTVEFAGGFNVFTGETGSGKSIIIDALNLVLGSRTGTESIRTGETSATVEALFHVTQPPILELVRGLGFEVEDGQLIVKRILSAAGKSRAFINGGNATISLLAKIGNRLVDIHGQHDHQTLLHPECHVDLLDLYGKSMPERTAYSSAHTEYQSRLRQLDRLAASERDRLQRQDLLQFQIKEIDAARLSADEEEDLQRERNKLRHMETLAEILHRTQTRLREEEGSVLDLLGHVMQDLKKLPEIDPGLSRPVNQGESAYYEIENLAEELREYARTLQFDPARLEEIEDRLAEINGLKRKYGPDIGAILEHRDALAAERESLATHQEQMAALEEELRRLERDLAKRAALLAEKRERGAAELKKNVEKELRDLDMKHVRFAVEINYHGRDGSNGPDSGKTDDGEGPAAGFADFRGHRVRLTPAGLGNIEFLFSSNPGEEPRPLAKIASGGELSRVMLALKSILNKQDTVPVLIFDEVDTGIGGKVAEKIGVKLKKLATLKQVFCITHLPQIAGMAGTHYHVHKDVSGKRTRTRIESLDNPQRVEEIARMSGGEKITEATRKHAKEMIK